MALSDTVIRAAKPREKDWKLADEKGLYLLVTPAGGKLWRLKFRHLGKEKKLTLGAYPEVSLAKARRLRDTAREQLADGNDPALERKKARYAAKLSAGVTFAVVAREFIETKMAGDGKAEATISKARWFLEQLEPAIGSMPLLDFAIPTASRFEHHHIVAGSGHGKTQTLQYLIAHDLPAVARGERSIVVLDSQGDLIRTISSLDVFAPGAPLSERIVVIDPTDVESARDQHRTPGQTQLLLSLSSPRRRNRDNTAPMRPRAGEEERARIFEGTIAALPASPREIPENAARLQLRDPCIWMQSSHVGGCLPWLIARLID